MVVNFCKAKLEINYLSPSSNLQIAITTNLYNLYCGGSKDRGVPTKNKFAQSGLRWVKQTPKIAPTREEQENQDN